MSTATKRRPVEDWSLVNANDADKTPAKELHRRAVVLAIVACAMEHDGKVHASWVRPLLPEWVGDKVRGGVMSSLVSHGILQAHGSPMRSDDAKNRNRNRWLSVYRVADWSALEAEVLR